jgi:hypothetical protein
VTAFGPQPGALTTAEREELSRNTETSGRLSARRFPAREKRAGVPHDPDTTFTLPVK